jgi:hypothetical protein
MSHRTPEERSAQRDKFVRAVVAGKSVEKVAKAAGISVRSVYNWLRREGIKKRIEQSLDRMMTAYANGVVSTGSRGHRTLLRLLVSSDDKVKLGAARALVGEMTRMIELRTSLAGIAAATAEPEIDYSAAELLESAEAFFRTQGIELVRTGPPPNGNGHAGFPHNGKPID